VLVEGVSEILTISQDLMQTKPDVASQITQEFVSGIVAMDGRMISLISPSTLYCRQGNNWSRLEPIADPVLHKYFM
jgi:chemotaxis signal transduction protein